MESYEITLISVNDEGKRHKFTTMESDLIQATRIVLTYKPRKNYYLDEINIVKGYSLF